jgi:[ribosomal protein S18]-alanine N-acetyltransferase
MTAIRRGEAGDLAEIAAIQAASPETAQWDVTQYLQYDLRVAVRQNRVAGFLVGRCVAEGERELLNLAVAPEWRRQGIARELLRGWLEEAGGAVYLEVRESNRAAQNLYEVLGFQYVTSRSGYYESPPEAAIVMKFHSC